MDELTPRHIWIHKFDSTGLSYIIEGLKCSRWAMLGTDKGGILNMIKMYCMKITQIFENEHIF